VTAVALPAPRHPNVFIRTFTHMSTQRTTMPDPWLAGPIPVKASSHRSLHPAPLRSGRRVTRWNGWEDQNKFRGLCVGGSDGTVELGWMSRNAQAHGSQRRVHVPRKR
jgi:hypothetical protein